MEPVQSTVSSALADTLRARSASLARRLLGGVGRASLVAYDLDPLVEAGALCHALSAQGDLVIACLRDPAVPATQWDETSLRVRVDIVKEAPECAVRITACAVHLLGELDWIPDPLVPDFIAGAGLPEVLVELGTGAAGRLGVVRADRVLLHDSAGVTPLSFDGVIDAHPGSSTEAVEAFPSGEQEWLARDLFGDLSCWQLAGLMDAAADGWDSALMMSQRAEHACSHVDGQVFCVDLDRTGLTLMSVQRGETAVAFFAFQQPVNAVDELIDRLDQLVEASEGVRPPRR